MKRLHELLDADVRSHLPAGVAQREVHQLTHDARAVAGPALVAVWHGKVHDGHAHLAAAQARGAVCALVERRVADVTLPQVVVPSPRRALARAARRFYDAPDAALVTVGITGTNGKTTCAALVASILQAWRGSAATVGTLGLVGYGLAAPTLHGPAAAAGLGSLTTPEGPALCAALAALRDVGCAGVALEASSIALDQGRLDGVAFDVVAWTNLTQDHLDYHGDMARYAAAKARLLGERRKPGGAVVLNADDAALLAGAAPGLAAADGADGARVLRFSARGAVGAAGAAADVYLVRHEEGRDGQHLQLHTPQGPLRVHTPLLGGFNVENVLLAVTTAVALQVPPAAIVAGVAALAGVAGRLQRVVAPAGLAASAAQAGLAAAPLVVVDYAHTPDALTRVLQATRPLTPGRLWCVFGCGGDRDAGKRPRMGAAVARGADVAVVTSDNPRSEDPARIAAQVAEGLAAAGAHACGDVAALAAAAKQPARYAIALDRAQAIAQAIALAAPDDTVVVAGKGHETTQTVGAVHHPFDDCVHARRALGLRQRTA